MSKIKHTESQLQRACVRWFRLQYPKHILFAIPNGGKRGVVEASIMKAEGVLAGLPDLFLAHTKEKEHEREIGCPGLFIEMKSEKGRVTQAQHDMHKSLRCNGYAVAECRSFDEFREIIHQYLS